MKAKYSVIILFFIFFLIAINSSYGCPPVAVLQAEPSTVNLGDSVILDGTDSYTQYGSITKCEWDYDYDPSTGFEPNHTEYPGDKKKDYIYESNGVHIAALRVTNSLNKTDIDTCLVLVEANVHNETQDKWYGKIQEAIDNASNSDVIRVEPSTYIENINYNDVNVVIKSTDPNEWFTVGKTVIHANDCNFPAVTFGGSQNSASVLAGFTITGGIHGIECNETSPLIRNCITTDNGQTDQSGGGVYNINGASPLISNCFIVHNDANNGAGIYNEDSSPTIRNCVISKNKAISDGGGLFDVSSTSLILNCTFTDNDANNGGGMYSSNLSDPNIVNSIFWDNEAITDGNQIFKVQDAEADPNFKYCDIQDSGGSSNWNQDLGNNDGGNIDKDPLFTAAVEPSIDGLISLWKFDEGTGIKAYDAIGNNDGNLIDALEWSEGKVGSGLDFSGESGYVEIPDDASLTPSDKISVAFWLYNRGGQDAGIYKTAACPDQPNSPGNSRAYNLRIESDTSLVRFAVRSSVSVHDYIDSNNMVDPNSWHHIAATFDQGQAKIYIDGVLDGSKTMSVSSIMNDDQPLIFGGNWNYCGTDNFAQKLNGILDDVRIYDKALSAVEVNDLYKYGLGVSGGGYHLNYNSPCINTGDPDVGINSVGSEDIDGNSRILGDYIDIGAYEQIYVDVFNETQEKYYSSIQSAIDDADNGDIIVVGCGTYVEDINFAGKAIHLRSGNPEDPCVVADTNILSYGGGFEEGQTVLFTSGEDVNSIINGLHIIMDTDYTYGGYCIYCNNSTPTIKNCQITNLSPYFGIYGFYSSPIIENCRLTTDDYSIYITFSNQPVSITDCEIISNNGGGTCIVDCGEAVYINNCALNNIGYGIYVKDCTEPVLIKNCTMSGSDGDGIYISGCTKTVSIDNCAVSGKDRGIYMPGECTVVISDSNIISNIESGIRCSNQKIKVVISGCQVTDNGDKGIWLSSYNKAQVQNCVISSNKDSGIQTTSLPVEVLNSTIVKNNGYGIYSDSPGSGHVICNCILWGNENSDMQYCSATYSCIEDGDSGMGNQSNDPYFVDYDSNDFHLTANSLCVDGGSPVHDYSNEPSPNGSRINIGAYGNTSEAATTSDTDGDGISDTWEKYYWPGDDPCDHDPEDDLESDGFNNQIEYLFGYDPTETTTSNVELNAYISTGTEQIIDPTLNKTVTVKLLVNINSTVDINFINTETSETVRNFSQSAAAGNVYEIVWDGIGDNGKIVERYFYDVNIIADAGGGNTAIWESYDYDYTNPSAEDEDCLVDYADRDPYSNIPTVIQTKVSDWCTRYIDIVEGCDNPDSCPGGRDWGDYKKYFLDNPDDPCGYRINRITEGRLFKPGWNTFDWYGYQNVGLDSGQLYKHGFEVYFEVVESVKRGSIVVFYDEIIKNLRCNPYRIIPINDEVTTITYDLACDANVTIDTYDPDGNYFGTLTEQQLTGLQGVIWYGTTEDPNNPDSRYISTEGTYRIEIESDKFDDKIEGSITVYK